MTKYKHISRDMLPYALIGGLVGIVKRVDDKGASAEEAIELIRAELLVFDKEFHSAEFWEA